MQIDNLQGRTLGRYQITGLLGRGGMAAVYRARDAALHREIALKVLYPHFLGDETQIARFKREAVVAAGLVHPNIVQIYDVGEEGGIVYIAMQLLPGESLADMLRVRGTLPLAELAPIVDQIASALDYAHTRNIIHRDIKPANILIEPPNRAVLTDFGIAKSLDTPGMTSTSVIVGTPDYMAPEQIGSQPIDGRVDVYALGVLLFRALTGRRPFEGGTDEVLLGHLNGTVPQASQINPALPAAVDSVIATAMARNPADRYHTAGDLAAALRAVSGLAPSMTARRETPPPIEPPTIRGNYAGDAAAAAIMPNQNQAKTHITNPSVMAAQEPRTRRGNPLMPVVIALLVFLAAGGGYILARELNSNAGSVVILPTSEPTLEPTVEPTSAPATTEPTSVPIVVEPTLTAPTAAPATTAPTTVSRPTAVPKPTIRPTNTPAPTDTPTPTATPTDTPTATPTELPLRNGFGTLWKNNPDIQQALGNPTGPEQDDTGGEQPFEQGSMFWFHPTDTIYVFFDGKPGRYNDYPKDSQEGSDTPPPEQPPEGKFIPESGFGIVWKTHSELPQMLGFATAKERGMGAAFQQFEHGFMLYSETGLGAGKTIYVMLDNGTYQRYKDPTS